MGELSPATILLLLLSVATLHPSWCKSTLDPTGIYGSIQQAQSCLDLAWSTAADRMLQQPPGAIPNCLRFAFHDAGTYSTATDDGGANGSIMQELNFAAFPQNNGLTQCPGIITAVMAQLKAAGCPQITAADTIQVAGAAAVALSGGPACPLLMGRPDKATPDSTAGLPATCDTAGAGIGRFTLMGFTDPTTAVTVLSGAHSIGASRATQRDQCSKGLGPMTANPAAFDGHYYTEVVQQTGKRGWFSSDRNLNAPGAPTAPLMQTFSANHSAFLAAWCGAYQEMSLLGVNTAPAGFTFRDGWLASTTALPNPGPNPLPNPGNSPTISPRPNPNNGSPNNGGPNNGGPTNGGPNNGGPINGGPNNGGPTNGGPTGPNNGGPFNGGLPNGGHPGGGPNGAGPNGGPNGRRRHLRLSA